jgi:hypothetical protein
MSKLSNVYGIYTSASKDIFWNFRFVCTAFFVHYNFMKYFTDSAFRIVDTVYDSCIYTFRPCKLFKYTISSMLNITGFLRFLWFPPIETRRRWLFLDLSIYICINNGVNSLRLMKLYMRTNEINL